MRLSKAWAGHCAQIFTLRLCCAVLSLCLVASIIQGIEASGRPPIIIERGADLAIVPQTSAKQTNEEIRLFITASLKQLLDSTVDKENLLVHPLVQAKAKRESAFQEKGVRQYIVIDQIKGQGGKITVTFDKVLAVKKLRTALATSATVSISKVPRTFENPYGLKLTSYEEAKNEENLAD